MSCGHTFCFACTQGLDETVKCCPQCNIPFKEQHAPNISIMQYLDAQKVDPPRLAIRKPINPAFVLCQQCKNEPAAVICFECSPSGIKFCRVCSEAKHNRDLHVAQNCHKPKPISQTFLPPSVPNCPLHPSMPSELFSLENKLYACDVCIKKAGFDTKSYVTIENAMDAVNAQLSELTRQMMGQVEAIGCMKQLDEAVRMLESEKSKTIEKLAATFEHFERALQKRRDLVIQNVEHEVCYDTMLSIGQSVVTYLNLKNYFSFLFLLLFFFFLKGCGKKKALGRPAREG